MTANSTLLNHDREMMERYGALGGMDEVGRGALAGPVAVGCVHIHRESMAKEFMRGVDDSKRLSPARRERLCEKFRTEEGLEIGIGEASNEEIDKLGIVEATDRAAQRAYRGLESDLDLLLVDGGLDPSVEGQVQTIEGGDGKSLHIAVASVLAKVYRDRLMYRLAEQYPGYHWQSNVGYGTAQHRDALKRVGPSPLHRRSFKLC
ncbi:MAG: ribonuclease HII [Candidatus Bipolaricaulota bacterium]